MPANVSQLSLRWKALVALSAVLLFVNASLALISYRQSTMQFAAQQERVRAQQARQLRELLQDRFQQMARLANVAPLLAPRVAQEELREHLYEALVTNGIMLDLEWDIRSAHWLRADGQAESLWGSAEEAIPQHLVEQLLQAPEQTARSLACAAEHCRQYLAAPMLWAGQTDGALVLGRSIADVLLTFYRLTNAEVAVVPKQPVSMTEDWQRLPAMTHPNETLPIWLEFARLERRSDWLVRRDRRPSLVCHDKEFYEAFVVPDIGRGIDAYILNKVTAERDAIRRTLWRSIVVGVVGLVLSVVLLFVIMHRRLTRLRRLAELLPRLAENRFAELRARLPRRRYVRRWRDEMDLMVDSVAKLTDLMEVMEQERSAARAELIWMAEHDSLTGLANRRRFNLALLEFVSKSLHEKTSGALLFFDLDQFKDVNDISGHQVGDRLLKEVAMSLRTLQGCGVFIGRLGGDEFGLVVQPADRERGIAVAGELQETIRQVVVQANDCHHQVSASIGIVLFPEHGTDTEQLMADADLAMYQAKAAGRGRWYFYSSEDGGWERANARVVWSGRIVKALEQDRFELFLQSIVDLKTRAVSRAEVLVRMRDENGKLIAPGQFIPVAEETGLIQGIDHWVVLHAIDLLPHCPGFSFSINLSGNALRDESLIPGIRSALERVQVDPGRVTFEITESAAIGSLERASRLMQDLHELGCRFALDDFGSGYASYGYLRQLPVDDVKIDGSFVRNIANSREDRLFVKAITELAHGMGKRVVAEFVENEAMVEILVDIGVDFAQGYYFGRPYPAISALSPQPALSPAK